MVVEDDDGIREMIGLALEADGHEVMMAPDGEVALEFIAHRRPDLILLDLKMPRVDGWEFARRYREYADPAPVIVVTAAQDALDAAAEIGAVTCVTKPFDLEGLLRLVDEVASRPHDATPGR